MHVLHRLKQDLNQGNSCCAVVLLPKAELVCLLSVYSHTLKMKAETERQAGMKIGIRAGMNDDCNTYNGNSAHVTMSDVPRAVGL